jgi:hypothetical protein
VCCAANQICATNPVAGASPCVTQPCPPSELPCPYTPGMCCPRDYQCCPQVKQCCKPGTECCGTRGCLLPSVCTP